MQTKPHGLFDICKASTIGETVTGGRENIMNPLVFWCCRRIDTNRHSDQRRNTVAYVGGLVEIQTCFILLWEKEKYLWIGHTVSSRRDCKEGTFYGGRGCSPPVLSEVKGFAQDNAYLLTRASGVNTQETYLYLRHCEYANT